MGISEKKVFVIAEIGSYGHIHYVLSIAKILLSQPNHFVILIIPQKQRSNYISLESEARVNIKVIEDTSSMKSAIGEAKLRNPNAWIFPTLEPVSKYNLNVYKLLKSENIQQKLIIGIHNLDLWFGVKRFAFGLLYLLKIIPSKNPFYQFKIRLLSLYSLKIVTRLKKSKGTFFVVSESIQNELTRQRPNIPVISIPSDIYDITEFPPTTSEKSEYLRVVIPGFISNQRRDYKGFLNQLKNLPVDYKNKLVVDLLGSPVAGDNDALQIIQTAQNLIESGFKINLYGNEYIPMETFNEVLKKSDLVAAIVSTEDKAQVYGKTKESGAPYIMIRCAKPGIVPTQYHLAQNINSSAIKYNDFNELFSDLIQCIDHPNKLAKLKEQAYKNSLLYSPEIIWKNISNSLL